jgi:hypothetical protein
MLPSPTERSPIQTIAISPTLLESSRDQMSAKIDPECENPRASTARDICFGIWDNPQTLLPSPLDDHNKTSKRLQPITDTTGRIDKEQNQTKPKRKTKDERRLTGTR